MCMKGSEEGCVLKEQQEAMKSQIKAIDGRLSQVEHDVGRMRSESQDGFKALNSSLANLAHDFGERMTNLDKRIIEEKEKWGATLRTILLWGAKALILGALAAMGVNIVKSFFE